MRDGSLRRIDCLIVGAGPAGLTAALYLRRFQREVVLADQRCSRARAIDRSHNYPGFPGGICGLELLQRLGQQLAEVGGSVSECEVRSLERDAGGFRAQLAPGQPLWTSNVLIATGVADVLPPLPGVGAVQERGLLRYCPICDGYEHRGQRIAVLGDGEHALREAHFLAHYSTHVSLVGLDAVPPRDPQAAVATLDAPAQALSLAPHGGVQITLRDGHCHHVDVLYAALGAKPRAELALSLGAQADELGNLRVDAHGCTCIPGLYAAGDVVSALDQLAVAVGHGAITATAIHRRLPNRALQAAASPAT